MGVLGKLIGGGFGFMMGGPIGAILGATIGHSFDKSSPGGRTVYTSYGNRSGNTFSSQEELQTVFMVSIISLAAKVSKADGVISKEEIRVFDTFLRNNMRLKDAERKFASQIFNEAKNSSSTYIQFATQLYNLSYQNKQLLVTLIDLLFRISAADGKISESELSMLESIASIFNISPVDFEHIKASYLGTAEEKWYSILGVSRESSNAEIKSAYKKLVVEYHPDKLMSKGLPEDFIKYANNKLKEINEAYDKIKKERKMT